MPQKFYANDVEHVSLYVVNVFTEAIKRFQRFFKFHNICLNNADEMCVDAVEPHTSPH